MKPLTHASLFSGIGGFDLAAEWAGWKNLFNCEKDPFCQIVLKHHFSDAIQYSDIRDTDFIIWRGRVDVLTGGFPCQPFSTAGKRKGTDDDRYLWPEMLRAIREIRPRWVVGENVRGIVNWNGGLVFEQVCADLENEGYEVTPYLLPACGVGAPHRRDRVWFIAQNTQRVRCNGDKSEKESGAGGFGQSGTGDYGRVCRAARITADSQCFGGIQILHDVQSGQPDGTRINGACCERTIADAGSEQFQNRSPHNIATDTQEDGARMDNRSERSCNTRSAPDAYGVIRKSRRTEPAGQLRQAGIANGRNGYAPDSDELNGNHTGYGASELPQHKASGILEDMPDWYDFPTQSPVCLRDDGISYWVDNEALLAGRTPRQPYIAIAKLRQESIKAYGNAIVPQVAYQIFKAINECERNCWNNPSA